MLPIILMVDVYLLKFILAIAQSCQYSVHVTKGDHPCIHVACSLHYANRW